MEAERGQEEDGEEVAEAGRRGLLEKAERKRRKKERRDERRGSDKVNQPQLLQEHEDVQKQLEVEKAAGEQGDRTARGVLSWRRHGDKEEEKKEPNDSTKLHIPTSTKTVDAAFAVPLSSLQAVAAPATTERVLPFADVTPPPTIDFPPYVPSFAAAATPLSSLIRRACASCALFSLVRLYVSYVSPVSTSIDHNTALMLFLTFIITAFIFINTALSTLSPKSASTISSSPSLSSELSRYLQAWDLIALGRPTAAIGRVQA